MSLMTLHNERVSRWWLLARLPLAVLLVSVLVPYYWMSLGSLKKVEELMQVPPTFVVQDPTLDNFYNPRHVPGVVAPKSGPGILQRQEDGYGFWRYFANSVMVTVIVTVISLLAASLVAFVLCKRPFPGSGLLFNLLLLSMMVPWEVTIIPNFMTVAQLGWLNSYWALLVPGLAKAFAVFYFRQVFISFPNELLDAATMDGAGVVRTWWSVVLPVVRPALAAIGIPVAIAEWNNFMWPLLVISNHEHATLPLALGRLAGALASDPQSAGVVMAASLLASLPAVVLFLLFQRQFIEGLSAGATKG